MNEILANPKTLIFQNLPCVGNGFDFWKNARKDGLKVGARHHDEENARPILEVEEDYGDGKLEIVTVNHIRDYWKSSLGNDIVDFLDLRCPLIELVMCPHVT
jgi:hypothetical protein